MSNLEFLDESLEKSATRYPEKPCIIFKDDVYTYNDINSYVYKSGKVFQELKIKTGDRVLISLLNCPEFVISFYALSKIGAIAVPINYWLNRDEVDYILKDSGANLIITDSNKISDFIAIRDEMTPILVIDSNDMSDHPRVLNYWDAVNKGGTPLEVPAGRKKDDVIHILYTSGTTGRPKGVMLTHESVMFCSSLFTSNDDMVDDRGPVYSEETICVTALPLYHCFGQNVSLISPLSAGATMILLPRFSPEKVLEAITTYKANMFAGVPTMFAYMAETYDPHRHAIGTLRFTCSAGAGLPNELARTFKEKTGVGITQGFGITEASAQALAPSLQEDTSVYKIGTIGLPLRNKEESTEVKIVDDNEREVLPNQIGELLIKGKHVMKGYWGMPDETRKTIRNGWLHTGDLAKKDEDGYFYIVDRKKDVIIVSGENIVPREIEEILYEMSDILEAAVVGIPDKMKGEAIKAVVALREDAKTTEDEIRTYCRQKLAKFKVPEVIEFRKELPKSSTGKILRKNLRGEC